MVPSLETDQLNTIVFCTTRNGSVVSPSFRVVSLLACGSEITIRNK